MKKNIINRIEKLVAMHNGCNNEYHYELKMSEWENYGKSRTYIKVIETKDNSKHYVTYDFGYYDNIAKKYVAGKKDALSNYDLSGNLLEEGFYEEHKFFTADYEAGNKIEEVDSVEEGMKLIKEYEEDDKKNGYYEEGFYCVMDEDCTTLWRA